MLSATASSEETGKMDMDSDSGHREYLLRVEATDSSWDMEKSD